MIKNHNYNLLKEQAIELRKRGLSYGEISKKIKVAKSTLSLWLKEVALTAEQKKKLYTKQAFALNLGPNSQKNRRQREIDVLTKDAMAEVDSVIPLDVYRFFGVALYWAEGSKTRMLNMTNSDPNLILFWVKWLEKIFKIQSKTLKARLNIYPQQSEQQIKEFWSDLTGIPVASFGKSYVKPFSTNYQKNNLYYGTIRIEVPKSTDLRYRVYGWLQVMMKDVAPEISRVEKKWEKLRNVSRPVNLV
jgi:hypothetical protein